MRKMANLAETYCVPLHPTNPNDPISDASLQPHTIASVPTPSFLPAGIHVHGCSMAGRMLSYIRCPSACAASLFLSERARH